MTEGHHYTACGLDYVYLRNGYKVHDTKHGQGVSISHGLDLHAAIARSIVGSPRRLRGQEVRFLRSMLKVSQEGLARVLRTKRGSVARWEGKPNHAIPGPADAALRMFYALSADKNELAKKMVDLLMEIDDLEHRMAVAKVTCFREVEGHWETDKLAA